MLDFGGGGPLALLHHANGFCAALWEPIALALVPHYRVLAVDARGHGDSSVPDPAGEGAYHWDQFIDDLIALVDHLAAEGLGQRVAYGIGHSFGGTSTMAAGVRRPDRFERIAMLDPVLVPSAGTPGFPPPGDASRPPLVEMARQRRSRWPSRDAILERWAKPGHAFASWQARARELYAYEGFRELDQGEVELKCAPEVEAAVFENSASLDPFALARRLHTETLLLWASRGNFPRQVYERFASTARDARLEDIDAGHLVPMETPEEAARRLLAFAGHAEDAGP